MDISLIIVLWIIFAIFKTATERKNPPPVPPQDSNGVNFEIPTLANDPTQSAEIEEIDLEEIYQQKKIYQQSKNTLAAKTENIIVEDTKNFVEDETETPKINLTPENAMNAIIYSEIFGKPKSLRKK